MNLKGISGLRGIAAFTVAYMFHYVINFYNQPDICPVVNSAFSLMAYFGACLPELFFMLSGFLMIYHYRDRISNERMDFGKYMLPRYVKLQTIVLVSMLATWIVRYVGKCMTNEWLMPLEMDEKRRSFAGFLLNVLGVPCGVVVDNWSINDPSWFVSVLLLCYTIFYVIVRYAKNVKIQQLICVALCVAGIFLLAVPVHVPLLYERAARGYVSFFAGVLLYDITKQQTEKQRMMRGFLCIPIMAAGIILIRSTENGSVWYFLACNFLIWMELIYVCIFSKPGQEFFAWKPFQYLGILSMSIYLWNYPTNVCIVLMQKVLHLEIPYDCVWVWLAHVVVSLIIAAVSYILIERCLTPVLKRKVCK